MVYAVNPDYGSYQWDLDLEARDANHDGTLTAAEYAPPAPFGDLDAAAWEKAGDALAAAVTRLRDMVASRDDASDALGLLNRTLEGADITEVNNNLRDGAALMTGAAVNVAVEYKRWDPNLGQYVDPQTRSIPFNLRQFWTGPPASLRDLLPPLYKLPGYVNWEGEGATLNVWPSGANDFEAGTIGCQIDVSGSWGTASLNDLRLPYGTGVHTLVIPAGSGGVPSFPGATLVFSSNWETVDVTVSGATRHLAWNGMLGSWGTGIKWSTIPDRTLSGLLPSPDDLLGPIKADADYLKISYGSIVFERDDYWWAVATASHRP
jgi:hypothetical protein